jgi:hypothetical protein
MESAIAVGLATIASTNTAGSSDDYRVGTAEWYRAMEREGRLNRPRR